jgi:branched-chain amino acid transport system ATP-binding protein
VNQRKELILQTTDLTKNFGGLTAVNEVNLSFYYGQLHSIIGPNGAGKTTFFNLLTGMFPPTSGRIYFKDRDITDFDPIKTFRLRIVRTFQKSSIFPQLTVLKNTEIAAQGRFRTSNSPWGRLTRKRREIRHSCMNLLAQFKLVDMSSLRAGLLAYGDKRRLEIVMGLVSEPDLLLLDEPTAGMSPEETQETTQYIKDLAKNITILLVEHDMKLVMGISDRVTVLHRGAVLADGNPKEIQEHPDVQSVYLGEAVCK